jgi:cyclase
MNDMFFKASPLIFQKAAELRSKPTPAEELLWNYIGQGQLGMKFRRQHPASMYVLDFYAHKLKLAIEIDGGIHSNDLVKLNDIKRQAHLESLGIRFVRFSNEDVLINLEFVLSKIKNKIAPL